MKAKEFSFTTTYQPLLLSPATFIRGFQSCCYGDTGLSKQDTLHTALLQAPQPILSLAYIFPESLHKANVLSLTF